MTSIQDREKAFEAKFALDEELRFKAEARRNKLVGLWAAGLLGKTDGDAEAYARDVVAADFEEVGHEDVVRSEDDIRVQMIELLAVAIAQVEAG